MRIWESGTFLRSGYDAGSFHFLSHIVVTCTERVNVGSLLADAGDYAFTFGGGGGMAIQESSCNDFLDSHTKLCLSIFSCPNKLLFSWQASQASMEVKEPRADFLSFPRVMTRDFFIRRNDAENPR